MESGGYNFFTDFGENPKAYRHMVSLIELITHYARDHQLYRSSALQPHLSESILESDQYSSFRLSTFLPVKQEDLDNLAYGFDCDFHEKNQFPQYFEPLKNALEKWQSLWFKKEPPLLAYEKISELELVIYDTRPSRLSEQVHLKDLSAFIYLFCDEKKGLNTINKK